MSLYQVQVSTYYVAWRNVLILIDYNNHTWALHSRSLKGFSYIIFFATFYINWTPKFYFTWFWSLELIHTQKPNKFHSLCQLLSNFLDQFVIFMWIEFFKSHYHVKWTLQLKPLIGQHAINVMFPNYSIAGEI